MTCPKCASTNIYTRFHRDTTYCEYGAERSTTNEEHLHHNCRHCGFAWTAAIATTAAGNF